MCVCILTYIHTTYVVFFDSFDSGLYPLKPWVAITPIQAKSKVHVLPAFKI